MEVNFYHIDNSEIYKTIAAILLKIRDENKNTLIYCKNHDLLKQIDDGLWSFSKTKFLPHASKFEKTNPKDHPTFLTDEENNHNDAKLLIMLDQVSDEFLKKFEKSFYFFGNSNLELARSIYRDYKKKSFNLNFFKKDGDKWVKAA